MTPIVDGLEASYSGQVAFKRINANQGDGPAIMEGYRILGHPTLLIFNRQGQELQRFFGPQPPENIEESLIEALKSNSQ